MNRRFLASVLMTLSSSVLAGHLAAQQSGQQNPYQGQSNPPADDAIVSNEAQPAQAPQKPAPGRPATVAPNPEPAPAPMDRSVGQSQPAQADAQPAPDMNSDAASDGSDAGVVGVQPMPSSAASQPAPTPGQPVLADRAGYADPDGDIVHPEPLRPGELGEGTTIRVRLMDRLSTAQTENGERFHSQVATDVLQGGQVLIPAGTEIDGTVVDVSSGHPGGTGSMRLHPDVVVFADGTRYRLFAAVTGTPGSKTHVVGEGTIKPDSRWKRDTIEYGGAVGAGAVTGAVMGGPAGALAGSLIGAGAITAHLLVSHPQATLEPGTTMILELTGPLQLTPATPSGN
jgi:hypothetical protein